MGGGGIRSERKRLKKEYNNFVHLPKKTEVIFCGHSFSTEGIKAAPRKVNAIRPCNLKQIQA